MRAARLDLPRRETRKESKQIRPKLFNILTARLRRREPAMPGANEALYFFETKKQGD